MEMLSSYIKMDDFVTQTLRDRDFGRRLKLTHLDERLREGENLKDIFAGSPEIFINNL